MRFLCCLNQYREIIEAGTWQHATTFMRNKYPGLTGNVNVYRATEDDLRVMQHNVRRAKTTIDPLEQLDWVDEAVPRGTLRRKR